MPEYLSPGVYVTEVEEGTKPIEGVSTSTAGFLGRTERGPTDPRLVTSFAEFKRLYGSYIDEGHLPTSIEGYFQNGGSRAYVGRVTSASEHAEGTLVAGPEVITDEGVQANTLSASTTVLDFGPTDGVAERTLTITNRGASGDADITVAQSDIEITGDDASAFSVSRETSGDIDLKPEEGERSETLTIEFDPDDDDAKEASLTIVHTGDNSPVTVELRGGQGVIDVTAVGPGSWGDHVAVLVDDATMYKPGENQLFKLIVRYWTDEDDLATAKQHHARTDRDPVPDPDVEEVYDNLSPERSADNFFASEVNPSSTLVELEKVGAGRPANASPAPVWLDGSVGDGEPSLADYKGDDQVPPEERTGFAGFQKVDGISMVCVPDEHSVGGLTDEIVTHCSNMGDRFAILQAPENPGPPGDVRPPVDSTYAAYYYPWLTVLDPESGLKEDVPPGGHVAGIYARSDTERGVHKAPANETVRGIQGLSSTITKGDQDVLNPRGVNCIRSFRGRGIRVWGARTTSSDPAWKYVNVRRLFLFLEESIDEGTQWVVFEPNDEQLWARVRQTIRNFLTSVWEDGALMGSTPEEAFFVKCDRSTMTQNDIDNGRLICEIGVAPVKPAEFVVFRISQWTGSAE
ncbi:phage tail sheath subtilisin-like domain-containing protein [Halopenitus sp. H-Gu1]|uniref:phage tail sheath subtilisin-like domain-containing protein n=1 Tax=Halopenitus sp. H-Gu1 TaxID=3242697 RepID=UPI00359E2CCA